MSFVSRSTYLIVGALGLLSTSCAQTPQEPLDQLRELEEHADPKTMNRLLEAADLEASLYTLEIDRVPIALPTTSSRDPAPAKSAFALISISADGLIRVSSGNERSVPVASDGDVLSFMAGLRSFSSGKPFVLRADKATPYRKIDAVFDAVKRVGGPGIFLLTAQDPAKKDGTEWPSVLLGGIWVPLPPWTGPPPA